MNSNQDKVSLEINGMSCGHCVGRVETALKAIEGVEAVKVDLAGKSAEISISSDGPAAADLAAAVNNIGFSASVM